MDDNFGTQYENFAGGLGGYEEQETDEYMDASQLSACHGKRGCLGIIAQGMSVEHPALMQATTPDFSKGAIGMPLYGHMHGYPYQRGASGAPLSISGRRRLGLYTGVQDIIPEGGGPVVTGEVGFAEEIKPWVEIGKEIVKEIGEAFGGDKPAPEDTEFKDVTQPPTAPATGIGCISTNTLLIGGALALGAIWLMGKK